MITAEHPFEVVDTFLPMAKYARQLSEQGLDVPSGLQASIDAGIKSNSRHLELTGQVARLAKVHGGNYRFEPDPTAVVDTTPGSNTFAAYCELLDQGLVSDLLATYNTTARLPRQFDIPKFVSGQSLGTPVVIKESLVERGVGKVLVEGRSADNRARRFLGRFRPDELTGLVVEEYITGPHPNATSFRVTTTPDGSIIASNLKYSSEPAGSKKLSADLCGERLRPLGSPKSPFYIAPRSITSNHATGGGTIPLAHSKVSILNNGLTDLESEVLEAHGIDPQTRRLPEVIEQSAIEISRVLGPSIGLMMGVDLMQAKDGRTVFLETNTNPSLDNVRLSLGGPAGLWTDKKIYLQGVDSMFSKLAYEAKTRC